MTERDVDSRASLVFGLLGAALVRGPLETFVLAFDALRALAVPASCP